MRFLFYSITFASLLLSSFCFPVTSPERNHLVKLELHNRDVILRPSLTFERRSISSPTTDKVFKLKQKGYLHGSGYYSTIEIGEPAQSFNVVLDTGSSDFWVISRDCETKQYCLNHQQFDTKKSITYKKHGAPNSLLLRYGTGSIRARTGLDNIHIGNITLENQLIADAVEISREFKDLPIDGILGLGLSQLSKTNPNKLTIIDNMLEQELIHKRMFSLYTQPAGGEIDFGGTDPARYKGSIRYAPTIGNTYWLTKMDDFSFGKLKTDSTRFAIVDSGTTLLITTPEDAKNIHGQIKEAVPNGDGTYSVPCALKGKLPKLSFKINGHTLSVASDDYILVPSSDNESMCLSGISGQNTNKPNHWILGDVFLKSYYTVFDMDNKRLGFANVVKDPSLSMKAYETFGN